MHTPLLSPVVLFDRQQTQDSIGQCDCNCDCACAQPSYYFQSHLPDWGDSRVSALEVAEFSSLPLDETYQVCYGPTCKTTVINTATASIINKLAKQPTENTYSELTSIHGLEAIHAVLTNLLEAGLIRLISVISTELPHELNQLTAWVHVTDQCNLRCTYCYLPHNRQNLDIETGKTVIQAIFRSAQQHNYSKIKIKYAGGEPLLRFDNILFWHEYAANYAQQQGVDLSEVILSNGTLLNETIAWQIKSTGMRLMISLDGIQANHDAHRRYANGQGSYDSTLKAIEIALDAGIKPDVSVTVSPTNAEGLPKLVTWLRQRDLSFSLNFARSNHYYQQSLTPSDQQKMILGMSTALQAIEKDLPRHSVLSGLIDRANLSTPHSYTCAVERHYLVFDTSGKLYRCQMEMEKPVGSSDDHDPLQLVRDHPNPINVSVDTKQECQDCKWKIWCTGGCPLLTKQIEGNFDGASPFCAVYKALYPEIFRLEGRRILRQFGQQL